MTKIISMVAGLFILMLLFSVNSNAAPDTTGQCKLPSTEWEAVLQRYKTIRGNVLVQMDRDFRVGFASAAGLMGMEVSDNRSLHAFRTAIAGVASLPYDTDQGRMVDIILLLNEDCDGALITMPAKLFGGIVNAMTGKREGA
jgi:hypothetical protein